MLLKQLDIVGFKSFANRVSIDFVPGVTAVVGPNGSGKSNISDAIRWVLGEQSAKSLRGGKMEDVIFSGSDAKKPLNVAEVTLMLDNEDQYLPLDYNEISVTRRIYRSGDSEYLLNNQPCRLKDIIDLFMDSGLGRESYSVIGQGKIDEILDSKSEEKRVIFEEAAGVLKYKTRKTKAEKKLAYTEENLERIDDILHELEAQVEPLKIQASIANDYLQKKKELEETEVALIVYEIEDYHAKWRELSEKMKELQQEEFRLSTTINETDADVEKKRSEIQGFDTAIDERQESLLAISEELEKLEGQREVLKERWKNTTQNRELLQQRIKASNDKIKQIEKDTEAKQTAHSQAEKKLQQIREQLQEEREKIADEQQDVEAELEQRKTDYIDVMNKQASIRNEIRNLHEQRSQLEAKRHRLDDNHQQTIEKRENITQQKSKLDEQIEQEKEHLGQSREAYQQLQDKLKNDAQIIKRKETELSQVHESLQRLRSRKEVLETMQEDYDGFFKGVKEILKAKRPGIEGAVAELIQVPKTYESAIETALGGAMQHVVVADEKHARQAINYLKKSGYGRATFLPLSVMKPRHLPERDLKPIREQEAFIGVASDLISSAARYYPIVGNLLGNVIIAKDLHGANDIARLLQHRSRVVTLEGDVVNPGGSMAGGSRKPQKHSLIGRQRELDDIGKRLTSTEEQAHQLENDLDRYKQTRDNEQKQLDDLRERGETLRLHHQKKESEKREIEIEEKNLNERLALYDREKAEYEEEMNTIESRINALESNLENVSVSEKQLDTQISKLSEQKQQEEASKADTQSSITDLKVKAAEQEQHVTHLKDAVDQLLQEKQENDKQLRETEEEFGQLESDMRDHSSGEKELEGQIRAKQKEKDVVVEEISYKRKQRVDMQHTIEDRERELKEIKRAHKKQADLLHAEEVKQNRLDVELDNRLNALQKDYELSFEAAKAKYTLSMDIDGAQKQVELLKKAIDELGTVNLGAIDEYERVSERVQFLTNQKQDLQQARANLRQVITEMDEEVIKRFEETFNAVREQFRIIFSELFGGGQADLQLSDPDDLLHTGVDVFAQPPGKNLQHMALLSGGERALTAITLLFAILKVRPVPFSVLDEVEAALDEANVRRFAAYLKKFSSETQFVIVTHRKSTMEEADVLYGVTMQQSGISNLVSVRLEESKQLVES